MKTLLPITLLKPWRTAQVELKVLQGCFNGLCHSRSPFEKNFMKMEWSLDNFKWFYGRFKSHYQEWQRSDHGSGHRRSCNQAVWLRFHTRGDRPLQYPEIGKLLGTLKDPTKPITGVMAGAYVHRGLSSIVSSSPDFKRLLNTYRLAASVQSIVAPDEEDMMEKFIRDGMEKLREASVVLKPHDRSAFLASSIRHQGTLAHKKQIALRIAGILTQEELSGQLSKKEGGNVYR